MSTQKLIIQKSIHCLSIAKENDIDILSPHFNFYPISLKHIIKKICLKVKKEDKTEKVD